MEARSRHLDFLCKWDKSDSQPGCSDLNVENAVSDLFDFNTPEENHLLLEGPAVTNVAATSKRHEEEGREKGEKRGIVVVTDEEVTKRNSERISANTRRTTAWSVTVWNDWAFSLH